MALEHALLVSLSEQPASGLDLARRFSKSIGFFWHATHQQIYKVLGRMERDGWVTVDEVAQEGKPDKKVYAVSATGRDVLAAWLAEPTSAQPLRNELAVKLRGAAFADDFEAVLDNVRANLADHQLRLGHYQQLEKRDYPVPNQLSGHELNQYLVLRAGIRMEQFWLEWLGEYLQAHEGLDKSRPPKEDGR